MVWLDRWIDAGFNVSLTPDDEYGEEAPNVPYVEEPPAPPRPRPPFNGEIVDGRVVFVGPTLVLVRVEREAVNLKLDVDGAEIERNQAVRAGIEAGRVRFVVWTKPDGTSSRTDERWLG